MGSKTSRITCIIPGRSRSLQAVLLKLLFKTVFWLNQIGLKQSSEKRCYEFSITSVFILFRIGTLLKSSEIVWSSFGYPVRLISAKCIKLNDIEAIASRRCVHFCDSQIHQVQFVLKILRYTGVMHCIPRNATSRFIWTSYPFWWMKSARLSRRTAFAGWNFSKWKLCLRLITTHTSRLVIVLPNPFSRTSQEFLFTFVSFLSDHFQTIRFHQPASMSFFKLENSGAQVDTTNRTSIIVRRSVTSLIDF